MTQVFIVMWFNGESYPETQEEKILAVFSSMEKANAYMESWREQYRKENEPFIIKHNFQQREDYTFEHYFGEEVWAIVYELQ